MRIKDLATRATKLLTGNAWFVVDNGTKVEKTAYSEVVKQGIEEYTGSTLAGSAQTVKSAIDALNSNSYMLNKINDIPSGGDLNTYTTPGIYNAQTSSIASTIINKPSDVAIGFKLVVEYVGNNQTVLQTLILNGNADQYTRVKNASIWNDWHKKPTRAEVDALNDNITPQIQTVSYTAAENINVRALTYVKMGKLVELNFYFDATAQITNNVHLVDIIDGLPKPIGSYATGIARSINGSFTLVSLERVHNTYLQSWATTPVGTYYYTKLLYMTDEE